jgi:hypothetical protein
MDIIMEPGWMRRTSVSEADLPCRHLRIGQAENAPAPKSKAKMACIVVGAIRCDATVTEMISFVSLKQKSSLSAA